MYSGMIVAALLARWRHPHLRSAARMAQAGMESSPSARAESTVTAYRFDHEFLQRFRLTRRAQRRPYDHALSFALPQLLSDDQMPRSSRKRSIGAELAIARMR